jgi:hypothetical protein
MRKIILFTILVLTAAVAYSQSGVIRELTGEVELKHAGSSAFVPARVGSEINRDTIVSTGFRSTAIIAAGSTVITVRPLTRLSFAEISSSAETESLNVNLQAGRVRVDVKPPAGTRASTTVRGPTATASVRGTSFEMDANNLSTFEGTVIYAGSDGLGVPVLAGTSSVITITGAAENPAEVAAAELAPPAPVGTGTAGESASSGGAASNTSELVVQMDWAD